MCILWIETSCENCIISIINFFVYTFLQIVKIILKKYAWSSFLLTDEKLKWGRKENRINKLLSFFLMGLIHIFIIHKIDYNLYLLQQCDALSRKHLSQIYNCSQIHNQASWCHIFYCFHSILHLMTLADFLDEW